MRFKKKERFWGSQFSYLVVHLTAFSGCLPEFPRTYFSFRAAELYGSGWLLPDTPLTIKTSPSLRSLEHPLEVTLRTAARLALYHIPLLFLFICFGLATPGSVRSFLLYVYSKITPDVLREPHTVPEIEPGGAEYKASARPFVPASGSTMYLFW